jgi:hypothetical protein
MWGWPGKLKRITEEFGEKETEFFAGIVSVLCKCSLVLASLLVVQMLPASSRRAPKQGTSE